MDRLHAAESVDRRDVARCGTLVRCCVRRFERPAQGRVNRDRPWVGDLARHDQSLPARVDHGHPSRSCDCRGHLSMARASSRHPNRHRDCHGHPPLAHASNHRPIQNRDCRGHLPLAHAKNRHPNRHRDCRGHPPLAHASNHRPIQNRDCRGHPPLARASNHRPIQNRDCHGHPPLAHAKNHRPNPEHPVHSRNCGCIPSDFRFRARHGPANRRSAASDSPHASDRQTDRLRAPCRHREPGHHLREPARVHRHARGRARGREHCCETRHGRCRAPGRDRPADCATVLDRACDRRWCGEPHLPDVRPARHRWCVRDPSRVVLRSRNILLSPGHALAGSHARAARPLARIHLTAAIRFHPQQLKRSSPARHTHSRRRQTDDGSRLRRGRQ